MNRGLVLDEYLQTPPEQLIEILQAAVQRNEKSYSHDFLYSYPRLTPEIVVLLYQLGLRIYRKGPFPDSIKWLSNEALQLLTSTKEFSLTLCKSPTQVLRVYLHLIRHNRYEPLNRLMKIGVIPNRADFLEEVAKYPASIEMEFLENHRSTFTASLSDFLDPNRGDRANIATYLTDIQCIRSRNMDTLIQLTRADEDLISEWKYIKTQQLTYHPFGTLLTTLKDCKPGMIIAVRYFDCIGNLIGEITSPILQSGGKAVNCGHEIRLTTGNENTWTSLIDSTVEYMTIAHRKIADMKKLKVARIFLIPKPASLTILATIAARKAYAKSILMSKGLHSDIIEQVYPPFMTWVT